MTADAVTVHTSINGSRSSYINTQMATVNIQMCSHKTLCEENKLHCELHEVQPESSQSRT